MIHYWEEEEKEALNEAKTMGDLAEIAVSVLARMPQPIVQVCGPMSTGGAGNLDANMKRFRHAVDVLFEDRMYVFDQIPFQDAMIRITDYKEGSPYNTDILDVFYHKVFSSGYVKKAYFLPDWQSSKGATWERDLLKTLPIEIIDFPESLFNKILAKEV